MTETAGKLTGPRALALGLAASIVYELPYFVRGPRSSLVISDNLEPNVAVLAQWFGRGHSPPFGEPRVLPFLLGGLPGAAASPEVDASGLFFAALPAYWAYVAIDLASRLVAVVGMMLLLRRLRGVPPVVALLSSLCFALIPHWTPGFLSVTGLPLVALALVTCADADRGAPTPSSHLGGALLACLAFPFFSSLPTSGMFVALVAGASWLALVARRRTLHPRTLAAVGLLGLGIAVANRGLIEETALRHAFVWQRIEFKPLIRSAPQALAEALYEVRAGQATAPTGAFPVAWAAIALYAWVEKPWRTVTAPPLHRRIFRISAVVFAGFVVFATAVPLLTPFVPAVRRLGITRISVFFPLFTYVLLAVCAGALWMRGRALRVAVLVLLVLQLGRHAYRSEWITARRSPSFEGYTAARAFDRIEQLVGKPRDAFKIACIGLPPSVAHFNGFQTVDGYWYLYPIEYKRRFRPVIARELAKNPDLRAYYDEYGSRVYVFSAELWEKLPDRTSFLATRASGITKIDDLAIDPRSLVDLGASYAVSAVEIGNAPALGLELVERIDDPKAAMVLWVYRLPGRVSPVAPP